MLRRLEKRVLVDLPSKEARQAMFEQFLPPTVIRENNGLLLYSDLDYDQLSQVRFSRVARLPTGHFQHTEGYSGADIRLVCKEAAMNPLRKIFDLLESLHDGKQRN